MALLFDPLAETQLVLGGSEEIGLLLSVLTTLDSLLDRCHSVNGWSGSDTYIVEYEKNFALL